MDCLYYRGSQRTAACQYFTEILSVFEPKYKHKKQTRVNFSIRSVFSYVLFLRSVIKNKKPPELRRFDFL